MILQILKLSLCFWFTGCRRYVCNKIRRNKQTVSAQMKDEHHSAPFESMHKESFTSHSVDSTLYISGTCVTFLVYSCKHFSIYAATYPPSTSNKIKFLRSGLQQSRYQVYSSDVKGSLIENRSRGCTIVTVFF